MRSDAALAERFAAGEDAAFAVLYERHRASVLAVCMGILGCRHDAEDAAQEVFAALAMTLRDRPPHELRAWLLRVARNAAIDSARRRRPRAAAVELSDPGDGPDAGIKAELDSVLTGIRELPASQRTALLMRELAGHSYQEIATILEIEEEAVRGLIARARIGLRNLREAAELPCASARAALAAEPDGRRRDTVVRRHLRHCVSCQAYRKGLRSDARALRCLDASVPAGGLAGSGALAGAAVKGLIAGGALTQAGAACAVSICSAGGFALLAPHLLSHPHRAAVYPGRMVAVRGGAGGAAAGGSAVSRYPVGLSVSVAGGLATGVGERGVRWLVPGSRTTAAAV
ncbi:MAG TPA: sigma-70 family RNA polymerase sigma factor, partial [Solirubrobacteraceae bacterium]|nr:sigma-70 family RNA polymerase sigma factor [Solirubrobacteraceae bacterium]